MKCRLVLFAFAVLFMSLSPEVQAQKKNNDGADLAKAKQRINALENQNNQLEAIVRKLKGDDKSDDKRIQNLQNEIQERDKTIQQLRTSLGKEKSDDKKDDQQLANLRKEVENLRERVKDLDATEKGRLVHAVFYKLKDGPNDAMVKSFVDETPRKLGKIPAMRALWVGTPSTRGAAASSKDYHVGIVAVFDNADALKRFLDHPSYKQHVAGLKKSWEPTVYDLSRD